MVRIALAVAVLAVLAAPATATAAAYAPPAGTVMSGGTGGYRQSDITEFGRLTGRRPAVYQFFFTPTWTHRDQRGLNWERGLLRESAAAGARPLLALSTARGGTGGAVVSTAALARGAGDGYLVDLNGMLAEFGRVAYVRFLAEMNNFNNPYCAFDGRGRARGRGESARAYRQAFRRAALILRGGPTTDIDARLRRLGMPPLRTRFAALPQPRVALLWVPLVAGLLARSGNAPADYWPGSRYADWVGTDFYANSPNFRGLERLYRDRRFGRKPFAFGEWAVWGREDPGFVRHLFGWVRRHGRARMIVYNQSAAKKAKFRLSRYPATARELRRQLAELHLTAALPPLDLPLL